MPAVSVIIPLYKTEKYVERCVRSVMAQTFSDIEILCVDDCSPDNSAAIVERLMEEDPRIKLFWHDHNKGLGGARNTGILAARGNYIASVDSDDYAEPTLIQALVEGSDCGRFDVVVCGFVRVDEAGNEISRHLQSVRTIDPITRSMNLFRLSNPAFWNKLWRKTLFTDNDIWFPDREYYQDQATTPRIYSCARNLRLIGGNYYNYVDRGDSIVNTTSDKHLMDRLRVLDVLKEHFVARGLYEQQRDNFFSLIDSGFAYHAGNVKKNRDLGLPATQQYLRHMMLLRHAYGDYDDEFRRLSTAQLLQHLLDHSSGQTSQALLDETNTRRDAPRVLVLTLHSGENEFEQCVASVGAQSLAKVEHRVFEGLGNKEGHQALYAEIMSRTNEFDLFVKVDADMVLAHPHVLRDISNVFTNDLSLDHYIVACHDFMTGAPMVGMHAFSNRVTWKTEPTGIFFDAKPHRPGRLKIVAAPASPVVFHTPNPSGFQAFHFGAHRALKVRQTGRGWRDRKLDSIQEQWLTLTRTWIQYNKKRDRRHGLALVAADLVFRGSISSDAHDYRDGSLARQFDVWKDRTDEELWNYLKKRWMGRIARRAYFMWAVGLTDGTRVAMRRVKYWRPRLSAHTWSVTKTTQLLVLCAVT